MKLRFRTSAKRTARRLSQWILALALLPTLWAAFRQLAFMVPSLGSEGVRSWGFYLAGGLTYVLIERVVHRPVGLYVWGHELTHVLSGLLSGAKIYSLKAHAKGGEVRLSKSNSFIALSPYVLPFYSVLVLISYAVVRHWWDRPPLTVGFQFMMGATLAFHLSLTFMAFHGRQPDLKILGIFFSGVLILLGNALILGLLCVSLFSKTPSLAQYTAGLTRETLLVWGKVRHGGSVLRRTGIRLALEKLETGDAFNRLNRWIP